MDQWEYKIIELPLKGGELHISLDLEKSPSFLNQLGEEGWEIVTVISPTGTTLTFGGGVTKRVYCIAKRRKT